MGKYLRFASTLKQREFVVIFILNKFCLTLVVIVAEMMNSPYQIQSDSFYFINGNQLIMHNKAYYKYTPETKVIVK